MYLQAGTFEIVVVDVLQNPDEARANDIFITPAVVRLEPVYRKVLADLSDVRRVGEALGLAQAASPEHE
jgi:hypothetical protein